MIGGLVPLIKAGRDRHTVESTWWLEILWFRVRLRIEVVR